MRLSTTEILRRSGLDTALLHNPRVTKALAEELTKRGFRKVVISKGKGKREAIWTDERPQAENFNAKAVLDIALTVIRHE